MANIKESLDELMTVDGAISAGIVDSGSGMILGSVGSGIDMEVAAAGNTEVVRAKVKTIRALKLNDEIEDILITLGKQYHIIRPSGRNEGVFIYFVLDSQRANLALARRKTHDVDDALYI
jgi:predicted regulator of Ras-like GTPase activity (Roadblock/LC7/MglB family)